MSLAQNIKKTINYSRKNGYGEAVVAAWERMTAKYYADYTYRAPDAGTLERQRAETQASELKFSILVPAYETQRVYMEALIESCIGQSYENWELVIADGSATEVVQKTVDRYQDARIRYVKLEENLGIAENTNRAIQLATGDYYGLLDHDDLLAADALYDFNLDLLLTNNYICHFMVVRADVLKKLEIRKEYDGSQDYDVILRIVSSLLIQEKGNKEAKPVEDCIVHVPKVLYHWRCHENSTADNPQSKMYAYEAGKKALVDFAQRMGWKVDVRHNKHLGFYRIEYRDNVLTHRPDVAAVGGFVARHGKVVSGIYQGQPLLYAGYMNRMDLYQNTRALDLRNMAVNKAYQDVYEAVTGHPYVSTLYTEQKELPQWIQDMERAADGEEQLARLGEALGSQLVNKGARLLLDPVCVRKL